jgi:hypothetical protein
MGRFVVRLMDEHLEAGNHTLTINLRNAYGGALPNGVYVLRAVIGNSASVRKFVKIK